MGFPAKSPPGLSLPRPFVIERLVFFLLKLSISGGSGLPALQHPVWHVQEIQGTQRTCCSINVQVSRLQSSPSPPVSNFMAAC